MNKLLIEFKAFAMRGNVVDLAVGIVIGAAFGKIVSALVDTTLLPLLGVLTGGIDFSGLTLTFGKSAIRYGVFLQSVIDFVIIAFAIFLVVKLMNNLQRKEDAAPKPPSEEVVLLREIRDTLRK